MGFTNTRGHHIPKTLTSRIPIKNSNKETALNENINEENEPRSFINKIQKGLEFQMRKKSASGYNNMNDFSCPVNRRMHLQTS